MNDRPQDSGSESQRDRGFEEVPAPQGLKKPPVIETGEDSGEWTRGGGSDPNTPKKPETPTKT